AAIFRDFGERVGFAANIFKGDAIARLEFKLDELERAVGRVKQRIEAPAAGNLVQVQFAEKILKSGLPMMAGDTDCLFEEVVEGFGIAGVPDADGFGLRSGFCL